MSVARLCRDEGHFDDVVFRCDDGQLVGHRLVLAAASTFLRNVFLEQSTDDDPVVVVFPNVATSTLAVILDFIYTVEF